MDYVGYFISFDGYDKDGTKVSSGYFILKNEDKKTKDALADLSSYTLDSAKSFNDNVESIIIVSFNRV